MSYFLIETVRPNIGAYNHIYNKYRYYWSYSHKTKHNTDVWKVYAVIDSHLEKLLDNDPSVLAYSSGYTN